MASAREGLMMLRWNKLWTTLALLTMLSTTGCRTEIIIQQSDLKDWFISRVLMFFIASVILGAVAAKLLCRLPIKAPLLDCISTARSHFKVWLLVLALVITPFILWLDAWFTQPFGEESKLDGLTVLSLAILNWRTLGPVAAVAVGFYLAVGIFTRYVFGGTCNCKYAFIRKFR